MSCGVGHICSSNLVLLGLWHRLAAVAPIRSLAWELPYAVGEAPQKKTRKIVHKLTLDNEQMFPY